MARFRGILSGLVASSAVAFVGAIPLAAVAGFYHGDLNDSGQGPAVVAAGMILFFAAFTFGASIARAVAGGLAALGRIETRPGPTIALTLIACGTLCAMTSICGVWLSRSTATAAPMTEAVRQMERSMQSLHSTGMQNINFHADYPPAPSVAGPMVLSASIFLLGVALIALGVWSSLRPHAGEFPGLHANGFAHKSPIPAADETRL